MEQQDRSRGSAMLADLRFCSASFENEFMKEAASRSRHLGKQFHLNRAGVWSVVLLRVLASREWPTAAAVLVVLLLPAISHWLPNHVYLRWRVPLKVFDNLLQLALGCKTHHHIYPNPASGVPSTFQMAAVLLTGNGVPWQLFNSVWGSLPFRYALPQQAALTIILLLFNRTLCSRNLPIQHAYAALQRNIMRQTARIFKPLSGLLDGSWVSTYHAGRDCAAAVLAAPAVAREAVRVACLTTITEAARQQQEAAPPAVQPAAAMTGSKLCMCYQPISQLLLGFVLPTFLIWSSELRLRRLFLEQHRSGVAHHVSAPGSSTGDAEGRHVRHAAGVPHGRQDRRLEGERAHQPGLAEYLMFAGPAVACMWSLAAAHA